MSSSAALKRFGLILTLLICCSKASTLHPARVYGSSQLRRQKIKIEEPHKKQRWTSLLAAIVNHTSRRIISACNVFEEYLPISNPHCCQSYRFPSPLCAKSFEPDAQEVETLLRSFRIQSVTYDASDSSRMRKELNDGDLLFVVGGPYSYSMVMDSYKDLGSLRLVTIHVPGLGAGQVPYSLLAQQGVKFVRVISPASEDANTPQASPVPLVFQEELDVPSARRIESLTRQRLAAAEDDLKSDLSKLKPYRGSLGQGVILEGYKVSEFRRVIDLSKRRLTFTYDKPELSGLKDYVDKFYPTIKDLDTFKMSADQRQPARNGLPRPTAVAPMRLSYLYNPSVLFTPFLGQEDEDLVRPESSATVIGAVFSFIDKLRQNSSAIDLHVVSSPSDAKVELLTSKGVVRSSTTSIVFTNLFRGDYGYTISKSGYKDVKGFRLNLVDEKGTRLRCVLYASNESEEPNPCRLR